MQDQKTAILLFSQDARKEFRHKSWGLSFEKFRQVYGTLVNRARATAKASGLPVFEADSSIQSGNDFGTRLVSAIDWVRQQGYHKMIVVGNDSPVLSKAQLLEAEELLVQGQSVLGRDHHGGAYLIGLDTEKISAESIKNIDWQTDRVFEQLLSCLIDPMVLGQTHVDLNTRQDLRLLAKETTNIRALLQLLWSLVFGKIIFQFDTHTRAFSQSLHCFQYRGPPALV